MSDVRWWFVGFGIVGFETLACTGGCFSSGVGREYSIDIVIPDWEYGAVRFGMGKVLIRQGDRALGS